MPVRWFLHAVVIALTALLSAPAGTAQTPCLVTDINTLPAGAGFDTAVRVGNRVFFTASTDCTGMELWVSDGTPAGTLLVRDIRPVARLVRDIRPFEASSSPLALTAFGEGVLFMADDGAHDVELWRSDGTPAGTTRVRDSPGDAPWYPLAPAVFAGELWFQAATTRTAKNSGAATEPRPGPDWPATRSARDAAAPIPTS